MKGISTLLLDRLFGKKKVSDEPLTNPTPSANDKPIPGSRVTASMAVAERPETSTESGHRHADPTGRRRRSRRRKASNGHSPDAATAPTASRAAYDGPLPEAFRALGIDDKALQAVGALGFTEPTPIQVAAIPLLLEGKDVVGLAQTGTGKTIAFGIPLAKSIDPMTPDVQALVLVPTRELANQVLETIEHLGSFYGFSSTGLVGGKRITGDFQRLEQRPQVIVGTPGRVIDHLNRGTLDLGKVRYVVLDEADQMFDIGFARDINYILRRVPREKQGALFSATMPTDIRRLVYRHLPRAEEVSVTPGQEPVSGVEQLYCEVAERDKILALRFLFEEKGLGRSLIFRRTRIGVDKLAAALQRAGVPAEAIHGDLRQSERDRVMADFRNGRLEFLVATNVAARGLDIPDIEHVINYDVPQNSEEYIHRVGRTARAGKTGTSVTFVSEWELAEWDRIVQALEGPTPEYLALPARWDD
jgi:ATP-dependent RNA helicase DeaD